MTPLPSLTLRFLLRTVVLALACGLGLTVIGCDEEGKAKSLPPNSGPDDQTESCTDEDGDGYGAGCGRGYDCDDTNRESTNECYRCQTPNEGCPCPSDGESVACGHESSRVGDKVTCVTGERTCSDGTWGACSIQSMSTQTLTPAQLDLLAVATNPTPCTANPCDPFCKRFDSSTRPDVDANTVVDSTGVTLVQTGVVGGGPVTGSSCGTQNVNATRYPLGITTMVQRSRNMTGTTLASVKSALTSFFQATTSNGIYASFDTFPCVGCTRVGPATTNPCRIGADQSMCCGYQYDGPLPASGYLTVPFGVLPGAGNTQRTSILNAITAMSPVTGSGADAPMLPALQGSIDAASQWASTVPNARPVVLLVTDALPDECGNCGGKKGKSTKNRNACRVQEIVQAAETAYFGTPSITTLVVGVQSARGDNLRYLDAIARAGSGGRYGAFVVGATTDTQILAAINQIRDDAVSCTFPVPPPSGSNIIDPSTATVTLGGTSIPRVTSLGACGTNNGFFYEAGGPSLELCPTTCTTARNDLTANIQIQYGCKVGCSSGSSRATPGPLDLLFMVDRSRNMATELKDSGGNDSGVTAWQAMQTTLRNFTRSPDAAGLGMAVSYYPPPLTSGQRCMTCNYCQDGLGTANCDSCNGIGILGICLGTVVQDTYLAGPVPWPYCPEPRNAGTFGDCQNNVTGNPAFGMSDLSYEYLVGDSGSCTSSAYTNYAATGGVNFNVLPNGSPVTTPPHWQNVFNSLGRVLPDAMPGPDPVARGLPAIQAAISAASSRIASTQRKTAVVFVTAGLPSTAAASNCNTSPTTVQNAVSAGAAAGVQTYVIGIGANATASQLNPIAQAGSGNNAFLFNTTADPSAFITAMSRIRRQAATCAYQIPSVPSGSTLDYTQTDVRLTSGSPATETPLTNAATSATCGSNPRWYYDNNGAPTNLSLCTSPCSTIRSDLNSRVDITYQCLPPAPTYSTGVATFEFDATGACGPDEVPVWGDFSWQALTPGNSKVTFAVATGTRTGTTVSDLSAEVPLRFTRAGALLNGTACAATYTSGGANTCGFTVDTKNIGPQYASSPADVYVDRTLANASLLRTNNYLRIRATLSPSSDTLSRPTITGWDLQVSCKAAR